MMKNFQIIVLAAGNGKRMKAEGLPKVLVPLAGRPMISYLMDSIRDSGVDDSPAVVVSYCAEQVMSVLGSDYVYINQVERLGTGHAVLSGKSQLEGKAEHVLVLYGDHPLVSAETIVKVAETHLAEKATLTLATTEVPDFRDWREGFYDFGRIVRNEAGEIIKIVEKKDASPEELGIREVNPAYFCFEAGWLWPALSRLSNTNNQHEYYLTDLVKMAMSEGRRLSGVPISPRDSLGVNTPEQLERLAGLTPNQTEYIIHTDE